MPIYAWSFTVPCSKWSPPTPWSEIHPQIIWDRGFMIVCLMQSSLYSSPLRSLTVCCPSGPCKLNLDSSENTTDFHWSTVHFWWASAQSRRWFLILLVNNGFFRGRRATKSALYSRFHTVDVDAWTSDSFFHSVLRCVEDDCLFRRLSWIKYLSSAALDILGRPLPFFLDELSVLFSLFSQLRRVYSSCYETWRQSFLI